MVFYIHGGYGEVGPTHLTVTQTFVGSNPTNHLTHYRGVAELADALGLGPSVLKDVRVRLSLSAFAHRRNKTQRGHFRGLDPCTKVHATIGATLVALPRTVSSVGRATDF